MQIKQLGQSKPSLPSSPVPDWMARIDVMRSLRLHKMLATLIALLIMGLGAAVVTRHKPTYEATSVIYVSPNFPATLKASEEQDYPYDSYIEEQVHSVKGYVVLANALRTLKPGVWQNPGESLESAVERLQRMLTVKRDGLSYQVLISLEGPNASNVATIVNAVTNSYLEGTQGEEFYGRDKRLESLRQERTEVQNELNSKLREQTEISQSLGLAVLPTGEGVDQIDTQVGKLRTDLSIAHEQRIEAEAKLAALENGDKSAPNAALDAAADDIIAADPSLLAMKSSLSQKRAVLMDQLAGLKPNHPLRKTTEEQLSEIEVALQQMEAKLRTQAAANLQQKLRTDLIRASTVESKLLSELQANTKQATQAAPSFQRAQVLRGEIAALEARYVTVDERTRNLELESKSPGSVHLFSAALVPIGPVPSKVTWLGRLLGPLALLLSLGAVVLIDYFDPRLRTAIDIEHALGFPPMATLFNDQDVILQVFDEGTLRLAGGIDHAARTAGVRTVVLTSVNAGAGTTSIVENLGSALAKLGRKTLTIDSTGTTPPVAYVTLNLEQPGHRGSAGTHARRSEVDVWSTAVVAQPFSVKLTPLTNLVDQAFKDLTIDYDLVLIDAPPVLTSAETEYLSRFADVTVLVAEAGITTKAQLIRASRLLERLQIAGMAVVLNKMTYRWANRATREDLSAFETRLGPGNAKWNPVRSKGAVSDEYDRDERVAKEDSTYA
jgi:succinoglycan biosynthesis transport protein ExoP